MLKRKEAELCKLTEKVSTKLVEKIKRTKGAK